MFLLKECLALDNNYLDAWVNLSNIQFSFNEFENALESIDKAIGIKKQKAPLTFRSNILMTMGRLEEAVETLDLLLEMDKTAQTLELKGKFLNQLKRYEEAIEALNDCLKMNPDYLETYFSLGYGHMQVNRLFSARNNFILYLKSDKKEFRAWYFLGEVYSRMSHGLQAGKAYSNAKYFNPELDMDIEPVFTEISDSIWEVDDEIWEEEESWQEIDRMRNERLGEEDP
jgi:tetratricopeptide (TPR) repeat protein